MPSQSVSSDQPSSPVFTHSERESSESESDSSIHTNIPYHSPSSTLPEHTYTNSPPDRMMTSPEPDTMSELSLTYNINAGLSKSTVNEKLVDFNYISWALSIQRALRLAGLHGYIKNEESMKRTKHYDNHRDCITNWLLNTMDSVNANKMKYCIMISTR